jgi:hypothetical protein
MIAQYLPGVEFLAACIVLMFWIADLGEEYDRRKRDR